MDNQWNLSGERTVQAINSNHSAREQFFSLIKEQLGTSDCLASNDSNQEDFNPAIQLIKEGKISSQELVNFLEKVLNQKRVRLNLENINLLTEKMNVAEMQQWHVFLDPKENEPILYMVDPTDEEAFNFFQLRLSRPLTAKLISYQEWQSIFHYLSTRQTLTQSNDEANDNNHLLSQQSDNVNQRLFHILKYALSTNASDIHIDPFPYAYKIRFRIDGLLCSAQNLSIEDTIPLITRVKSISQLDISEKRRPQDGSMEIMLDNNQHSYRISTCPTVHGEKLVIRILKKENGYFLEQLGYNENQLKLLIRAIHKPQGLILVCGPTGSGKTTTLYTALRHRLDPSVNIMSIEDPVEMKIEGLNQVQVNSKIDLDFNHVLRSMLRQDPDIIMIGEIRDVETADIAIKAAQTGHLVFSTLHTQSAIKCFNRLLAMGIREYDLLESLNLIISQRLVRKLCAFCKKPLHPNLFPEEMAQLFSHHSIYTAEGCINCQGGYSGRFAIYEMISFMAERDQSANHLKQWQADHPLEMIEQQGINAVLQGLTTYDEIKRVIL